MTPVTPRLVLLAEDDPDDVFLIRQAASRSEIEAEIIDVGDGVELLRYLRREGDYALSPRPELILLDLRMPRMGGHEALTEIKRDPTLQLIPVIVMSTSAAAEDVELAYRGGAAGYFTKPSSFAGLIEALDALNRYWFHVMTPPPSR